MRLHIQITEHEPQVRNMLTVQLFTHDHGCSFRRIVVRIRVGNHKISTEIWNFSETNKIVRARRASPIFGVFEKFTSA